MPPLYHTLPGAKFDINKSQILDWILKQDEIKKWLVGYLKNTKYIEYNPDTKLWTGINYYNHESEE